MSKDYYSTLGVPKNATAEEIKKAFREKAHLYHPDKSGGDEAKFKEANEAYQVLSNEQKRSQYDQFGSTFDQNGGGYGGGAGGFNWQDFARQGGGSYSSGDANFDFGDIFGDIFSNFGGGGSQGRSRRPTRGADIEAELEISFAESFSGIEKDVELEKYVVCEVCSGTGAKAGSKVETCKTCGGSGQVEQIQRTILGAMRTVGVCPECHGEGKTIAEKCSHCHGAGRRREREELKIKIPAGIADGQTIRLTGKGEAGERGVKAGDLYLTVRVKADARFTRRGDNVLSQLEITFRQAALGDKIDVATAHGDVKLKIPEGTQTGKVFKLTDKGMPRLNSSGFGDHLVEVVVATPTRLSKAQKKALEELD